MADAIRMKNRVSGHDTVRASPLDGGGRVPTVSVVIPAYNCANHLGETLASVFAQTLPAHEVIVVNDGSPDTEELERVIEPHRDRIVYIKQDNRGPSAARNAAIGRAQGEYVAFLDSDDVWLPEYLQEQMRALGSDPTLDLIYSDALLFGDAPLAGRTFMQTAPTRGPVTIEGLLLYRCSVITTCVVARRQALIDAGLFDESLRRVEDFDLWVRMAHEGARLGYQARVLARHRVHASSLAADVVIMIESRNRVLRKIATLPSLSLDLQATARAQLANSQAELALEQGKRHLVAGDYDAAVHSFQKANSTYGRLTLSLEIGLLRIVPQWFRRFYIGRMSRRDARSVAS
jgi:GT2 family glycosyltransferase